MKKCSSVVLGLSLALCVCALSKDAYAGTEASFLNASNALETRVEDLLARLTLDEKIKLCHADSKFTTAAIPRLGIPRRWLSDGPHGVREDVGPDTWAVAGRTDDFATAMPCGIALAATWNPELARREGEVIGQEARRRGKDIMLGPGLNIMRSPLCGRNFEYFGEDPFLAGRMPVSSGVVLRRPALARISAMAKCPPGRVGYKPWDCVY